MSPGIPRTRDVPSTHVESRDGYSVDTANTTFSSRRRLELVGLLCRLALGGVLVVAGYLKITDLNGSIQSVVAYDLFPYEVAKFIAITLPVVEIAVGALLVLGLFTRLAAVVGTGLMLVFIAGIASAWVRGLAIDCGCFGTGGPVDPSATRYLEEIVRDGALALAGLWLIVRPSSLLSLDGMLIRTAATPPSESQERTD